LCKEQASIAQGLFGFSGTAFVYAKNGEGDDVTSYLKEQPSAGRKNGFGSRDATKFDEFSSQKRSEQFRETLRKEQRIMATHGSHPSITAAVEKWELRETSRLKGEGGEPSYLYDIGRTKCTEFDSKKAR
jgi:hypothetical protein